MKKPGRSTSGRRLLVILALGGAAGLIALPLQPVASTLHRLAFAACLGVLWFSLLALFRNKRPVRYALIGMALIATGLFALPARPIQQDELRGDYVRRMKELSGTRYIWGGESARGIDCSGLPRKALRDALLAYSLRHVDGGTLRMFAKHWWFDASAKALGEGYRGYTGPLAGTGTIAAMPYDGLEPGDLAVTVDRVHILAYLGGDQWVQADPGLGVVAILNGRSDKNGWFGVPVTMHRWSVLEDR